MKKLFKKAVSLLLALTLMIQTLPTSCYAFSPSWGFRTREIFGYENATYICTKDDVPLRASPHNKGEVLDRLPENYPVTALGLYQTSKGTYWVKVNTSEQYEEAWVWLGNLEEHDCSYVMLEDFDMKFCSVCGHLEALSLQNGTIIHTSNADMDKIHMYLCVLSLIPVAGNAFDAVDGLLYLAEGEVGDALLSFAAVVPALGSAGNTLKAGKTLKHVSNGTEVAIDVGTRVTDISVVRNTNKLTSSMNDAFDATGLSRYNKSNKVLVEGKRTVAAHHIVAIGDKGARPALNVLLKVGLDPNTAVNGVYLCMTSNNCLEGAIHAGRHSADYYNTVNNKILDAYNSHVGADAQREAVIKALDELANDILSGNLKLR